MTWTNTPIDGQQNIPRNKIPSNQDFRYINNKKNLDHYWHEGSDHLFNGRHRQVSMPNQTSDPAIGVDMDSVFYSKLSDGRSDLHFKNAERVVQLSNPYSLIASVRFNGIDPREIISNPLRIQGKPFNVSSIIRAKSSNVIVEQGVYRINFSDPIIIDQYNVQITASKRGALNVMGCIRNVPIPITANYLEIVTFSFNSIIGTVVIVDANDINVRVYSNE